ncbi:hypothetical protein AB0N61_12950 [Microbacterium sp. NPDC089320]|uniref:hypothetical protein n=1 Tax=Microbacterium sp. NPDC089320 TaxID=3155182 RepID=UPI00342527DA
MSYSDDDLDRLFRAAAPARRPVDAPLDARAIATRESIIRGARVSDRNRPRRGFVWAGVTTATAAVVIALLVAVNVLTPSQSAVALMPPPLEYTPAGSVSEVLSGAERDLLAPPDVVQASTVHSVTWGWNVEMASANVEIVPQETTFEWSPDGGSTSTTVAGDSYWSDNERPDGVEPSPYQPGELIDRVVTPADAFTLAPDAVTLRGSSTADLERALAVFGATDESSSGELLSAVAGLLQYWTLDDEQHATLLRLLDEAGGLTVLGETEDRLGRDVIGVRVAQVIPEREETFFLSADTGRIVGMESELVKPLNGLPTGVILYTMWDAG